MSVTTLERRFKLGSVMLADPDPDASPDEAVAHYRAARPMVASCTLGEPYEEGGYLVYPLERPAATTKGHGSPGPEADEAKSALADWAERDGGPGADLNFNGAYRVLGECLAREPEDGCLNAFDVPLA